MNIYPANANYSRRAFLASSAFASLLPARQSDGVRENLRPDYMQNYMDECFAAKKHPMGVACHPLPFVGSNGIDIPFKSGSSGNNANFRVFHYLLSVVSGGTSEYMSFVAAINDYGNGVDCPGALYAQLSGFDLFGDCPFQAWQTNLHRGQIRRIADAAEKIFDLCQAHQADIERVIKEGGPQLSASPVLEAFSKGKYQVFTSVPGVSKETRELINEIGGFMRNCSIELPNGKVMPAKFTD